VIVSMSRKRLYVVHVALHVEMCVKELKRTTSNGWCCATARPRQQSSVCNGDVHRHR